MLLKTRHATPLRWALNLFMRVTTLDELLVEECSQYGPIIAIGNPNERIKLFGAFREFHEDSVWQDAVENYAREAKAIIVAVDETPGLSWELELIGRNNYLSKTLLVVPDRFKSPANNNSVWHAVFKRLGGEPFARQQMPVVGCFRDKEGDLCLAMSHRFSANEYHVLLRCYFLENAAQ
jgi:hypothetical protein